MSLDCILHHHAAQTSLSSEASDIPLTLNSGDKLLTSSYLANSGTSF